MVDILAEYPDLPIPTMATESTFVAMLDGYEGNLFTYLYEITRLWTTQEMPVQEHYNWTTPRTPNMDRCRLIFMFGSVRYEIDAPLHEVFGNPNRRIGPISEWVRYIGENVNTMHIPSSQPDKG